MVGGRITFPGYARLIRGNANFRRLWLAQLISEMGDWLYSLAIYSIILERTGAATSVGAAIVLQLLPQFFMGPLAGAVNDRYSRRKVMIYCDLARCATVAAMFYAAQGGSLTGIYLLLFLETTLVSFFEPARTAIVPNICRSDEETLLGNALSASTWSVALATGAAVGGYLGVLLGRQTLFAVNAVSFLVSAWLIQRMRFEEPHVSAASKLDWNILRPVREGWTYVRSDSRLLATLLLKGGCGLVAIHWILIPIFGERVFPLRRAGAAADAGLMSMSLLMVARGFGALAGPLTANRFTGADQKKLRLAVLAGFGVVGCGYFLLAYSPTLAWAAGAVFLLQSGSAIVWVLSTTLLHMQTEDRFRGRVFATDFGFIVLTMSLATFLAGLLVDLGVSPRQVAFGNGFMACIPVALWWRAQKLWDTGPVTP